MRRRIPLLLAIVAAALLVVLYAARRFEKKGSLPHLRRIAAQLNARADEFDAPYAEVVSAHAAEKRLSVVYGLIDTKADEVDPTQLREARELFRRDTCRKKPMRELLEAGVTFHYVIRSTDDVDVMNTEVLAWECTMDFGTPPAR